MKICTKCNQEKYEDQFHKQKSGKNGKTSWCVKCFRVYQKSYYLKHRNLTGTRNPKEQDRLNYLPENNLIKKANVAAWTAGFVDGEGSFSVRYDRSRGWHVFVVSGTVCQNDKRPLLKLQSLYGGRINQEKGRTIYRWGIYGLSLAKYLREVIPFLIVKKEEAELCLKFRELLERRNGGKVPDDELKERFDLLEKYRCLRSAKKNQSFSRMHGVPCRNVGQDI